MQNQNPNTSHAEFKKRNKKRKENCLFIYLFCLVFLQLNVRYNEKRVNFCPVLSPNYLLKNPSILAFSLSYYSLGSCSGWWFSVLVFCFVSFTCVLCGFIFLGFFFYFHCQEGTTFIRCYKYLPLLAVRVSSKKGSTTPSSNYCASVNIL